MLLQSPPRDEVVGVPPWTPPNEPERGARARSAVPPQVQPDIDWNRLVIGGWLPDTRRDTIEREATELLNNQMQVQDHVKEIIVFGRRASTCHVLLNPLPDSSAGQRISSWQTKAREAHIIKSSGKPCWLTAHKSPQRRYKNRITKHALDTLELLLGTGCRERLDCDWARQVIWLDDHRVAGLRQDGFGAAEAPHLVPHSHYDDRQQEEAIIYFHAARLAHASGKTVETVQRLLAKGDSQE